MPRPTHDAPPLFQILDEESAAILPPAAAVVEEESDPVSLLRQMLAAQERQTELLEELMVQLATSQRQRAEELDRWRKAHPQLARNCRQATEALAKVQARFLQEMTNEINANAEALADGEFVFNEFFDRFGPRLTHLNSVLHMLAQLSSQPTASGSPS